MWNSTLIRISAISAILAGTLRAIASLVPETTPNVFLLYFAIDLFLLVGVIGLSRFVLSTAKLLPFLGPALMLSALLALIARDVRLAPAGVYAGAAAIFSVGLILFAIELLRTGKMQAWIPIAWIISTVVGPVGFFVQSLHSLFIISGLLFGVAFAASGFLMWRHVRRLDYNGGSI